MINLESPYWGKFQYIVHPQYGFMNFLEYFIVITCLYFKDFEYFCHHHIKAKTFL